MSPAGAGSGPQAAAHAAPRGVLDLPLVRLRLRFERERGGTLPAFTGSMWRGALGHALRRIACRMETGDCHACPLRHGCPHALLFETPPPPGAARMRRYRTVPHPFVLAPEEDADAPERGRRPAPPALELGLVVVGRAARWVHLLVAALALAARGGLGRERVRYGLAAVAQETVPGTGEWRPIGAPGALSPLPPAPPQPLEAPPRLRVRLRTPLRLVRDESLVGPARFRFGDLGRNLLRRIASLHCFHGHGALEADYAALARAFDAVPLLGRRLRWREWERWSSRQRTRMRIGGIVGEIETGGGALARVWPWVQLGALVHAGKATSMGLGRYELEVPDDG